MIYRYSFLLFALCLSLASAAQDLNFLGIEGVRFGMPEAELKNKLLQIDTSSSYTSDTAFYLKVTTCHIYRRSNEKLQLNGFTASRIEFEFCDGKLAYVFVTVNGDVNSEAALRTLKQRFPKLACKSNPCTSYDTRSKKLRLIANHNLQKKELSFVLISV
ncbi:MAG: hypothetical protein MUC87_22005 [Bacteroidia bacterium]|jgi:hypothetical protein|nr:hypothetical protein [Bacteroidia bacterium]